MEPAEIVPPSNRDVHAYLFVIECGLRELVVESMNVAIGPRWYVTRTNRNMVETLKEAREYERRTPWTRLTLFHPIYYLDFPDLKAVIDRA
jgi:hypothetical protein